MCLDKLDPLDLWQLEEYVRCLDCDSLVTLHPPDLVVVTHRRGCPTARDLSAALAATTPIF